MKKIFYIIKKEFLQFRRDRRMFGISFVAPVIQLLLLGYAANLDVKNVPIVVYDMDNTSISRELITKFTNSGYFEIRDYIDDPDDIDRYIDSGEAELAFSIPRGFANELTANRTPQLQVITDGSNANSATIGLNYASMIISDYSTNIMIQHLKGLKKLGFSRPYVEPEIRIWYNPDLKSRNFMVPGVLALLLMVVTMILTSLAIVKEREIGTMEQLIVTPVKPYQLIIGKLTPFTIIGLVDIILVLIVAAFWFGVPVRGSILLLYVLCAFFLLNTLGLGLLVSTLSRNQQQAMLSAIFFIMMPMLFFSGFVFPIENMPMVFQYFSYLLPLRYFFVIVRGIFLKGVGIVELWDEAGLLLFFGLLIMTLSIKRFRKNLE
ncbi:MAG: ABC transporter permease subunit [candidate division Zixibacteria bacterium]|nr:ABC transporter permease subunit [candidate division Zixibacteria bacterium]